MARNASGPFFMCNFLTRLNARITLIVSSVLCALAAQAAAPALPADAFFRGPDLAHARLSPDGKSLAGLNYEPNGAINLAVRELGTNSGQLLRGNEKLRIFDVDWLNDQTLLIRTVRNRIYVDGLYTVDRADIRRTKPLNLDNNLALIGRPRARPKNALLWVRREENDLSNFVDLFEVSSDNTAWSGTNGLRNANRLEISYPEPKKGSVLGYTSDVEGELALCYVYLEGRVQALLYDSKNRQWTPLPFSAEQTTILAVEADHDHLWLSEFVGAAGFEVRRFSVRTGERGPAVVTDARYNPGAGSAYFSRRAGTLAGLSYEQRRTRNVWLDPKFAAVQRSVDHALRDTDNRLVSMDDAEEVFLFYCASDRQPGAYFVLDSKRGELAPVAHSAPWLAQTDFPPTHAIKFTTRDNVQLDGYLTLPRGASAQNKVPLLVLCHGGPEARDSWEFDAETQFFVSRGYAVLRPNYRGSSGLIPSLGHDCAFNYRQMHDDVTDATRTFRQLDVVDRRRVAIMGASFGGFLAVAGAAFEEGLYACAVTNSGVFDWETLVKEAKWAGLPGEYQMLTDRLGKPGADRAQFENISPLASAERIKIPVFVAHGREDNVVDIEQSWKLVRALKKHHASVETFFPDFELHGFSAPNRVKFYTAVEAFLAKHLGTASGQTQL